MMKFFNIVVVLLVVNTNIFCTEATCVSCKVVNDMFEEINKKLDQLLSKKPAVCKELNYANLVQSKPKQVISTVRGAFGAIANGNDVYITGYSDGFVYRFNSQSTTPQERLKLPGGRPTFLDIHNGYLYVTSHANAVYKKPLIGGSFTKVLSQYKPVGIKWSPDGERLIVSEWETKKIHVYNKILERISTFSVAQCAITYPREISFDSDGRLRITTYSNKICLYDKTSNGYQHKSIKYVPGAIHTEGYLQHCDGTIILADRGGKLFFLNKNYGVKKLVTGFGSTGDVALTTDGVLYVTDLQRSKVYLYSLF